MNEKTKTGMYAYLSQGKGDYQKSDLIDINTYTGMIDNSKVTFDKTRMHYGDIKLMSVFHHTPKYFRMALDYIASGEMEVEKLITDTLPLDKVKYAMNEHIQGRAIKFLINPWA